ncbi:MAG: hypothetical protein U5R31_16170 [Acidimicrobiia bacterium]|nr:hypothetical protein [Acidimicrobiia bacterium]
MAAFTNSVSSSCEIDLFLGLGDLASEIEALLDQLEPLQRVGIIDLGLDPLEPLLHGFGGALASPLRFVGLERFEIATNSTALCPALGEGRLVLGTETAGFLGRSHYGKVQHTH